ncbi:fucolectin-like [Mercenaria mercenaria]|uniref:fucolectin-like n=1 Tax=Mercenaria mercenaria TaxID=6596 RepID=UPI00234F9441|nr:fucolectin-like [Mercenaria mercenaria]
MMYTAHIHKELLVLIVLFYLGAVELHVLENLALNKEAYETHGATAGRAVDGGLSQYYPHGSCTHTSSDANIYWEVNLGSKIFIDHVTIYNRGDCCGERLRDVELYIGYGKNSYRLYGFHEDVVGSVYTFELKNVVFGQWVRITRLPSVIDYLTLCEVQVFGYNAAQYFRISANQVGAEIQRSVPALSALQCAYICFKTNECRAANFDEDTYTCDLMSSASNEEETNGMMLIHY